MRRGSGVCSSTLSTSGPMASSSAVLSCMSIGSAPACDTAHPKPRSGPSVASSAWRGRGARSSIARTARRLPVCPEPPRRAPRRRVRAPRGPLEVTGPRGPLEVNQRTRWGSTEADENVQQGGTPQAVADTPLGSD